MIPSRALVLLTLVPLVLAVATLADRTMLLPMLAADLGIALIAAFDAILARRTLVTVKRRAPAVFSLGRPNLVTLEVRSTSRRRLRVALSDDLFDTAECDDLPAEVDLAARGVATARYHVRPTRRGAHTIGDHHARYASPLGLWIRQANIGAESTVKVYPDVQAVRAYDMMTRQDREPAALRASRRRGGESEFERLRDYRRGDPLKHVHWRSVARSGRLVVKEYQDEHLMRHGLVLDSCCAPEADARFEEAVAVAASFACTVPDQEALLDLLLIGRTAIHLTAGRGVGQVQPMLEALALVRPSPEPRLAELEALIAQHRGALSSCMLVLLEWDGPRRALVARLHALRLPLTVLLLLPEGQQAPAQQGAPDEQPERMILLQSGRIAEGLRALEAGA